MNEKLKKILGIKVTSIHKPKYVTWKVVDVFTTEGGRDGVVLERSTQGRNKTTYTSLKQFKKNFKQVNHGTRT